MRVDKNILVFNLKRLSVADCVYFCMVAVLCSSSAAFPLYVYMHPGEFGPPVMQFDGSISKPGSVDMESAAVKAKIAAQVRPRLELDRMMTGSIQPNMSFNRRPATEKQPYQPFPGMEPFPKVGTGLLFVGPNRILAFDSGRIVSLRTGSRLADGTQIKQILRTGSSWTIRTSSGKVLEWSPHQ